MTDPAYPAARIAARSVHPHVAHHLAAARQGGGTDLATLPGAEEIEAIIDASFWAGLRREEGYTPKISLAFLRPDQTANALIFEQPLPVAPKLGKCSKTRGLPQGGGTLC